MGKENASEDWNCIISMFLRSFNIYFVFGYACFMCICLKTAIWLFWDKVWLFLVKTGWQPWRTMSGLELVVLAKYQKSEANRKSSGSVCAFSNFSFIRNCV